MAAETEFVDWTDLKVQAHWYKIRREFEDELRAATSDFRKEFDVRVKLNSATIVEDAGRSYLRVPISAVWRKNLEQTIAALLVTAPVEDEHSAGPLRGDPAREQVAQRFRGLEAARVEEVEAVEEVQGRLGHDAPYASRSAARLSASQPR